MVYNRAMPKPLLFRFHAPVLLPALALACLPATLRAQTTPPTPAPTYSQIIVFGDSLSDVGNDADQVASEDPEIPFEFPGPDAATDLDNPAYGYTDGRFTDGTDTDPAAVLYTGVWHEQLAKLFLDLPAAKASLDGGFDYAFGGATTADGQSVLSEGDTLSIHVDNMTRQMNNYLDNHTPDAAALYIVWGGANDISDDPNSGPTAIANEVAIIQHLAEAGAKTFLVPNLPPLGDIPKYDTSDSTSAAYNGVASNFRDGLNTALDTLETTLAGENLTVKIYRLDVYNLFLRLVANAEAYGFQNVTDPSQGAKESDHHLFWDIQHPTTAGHFQLAAEAYTLLTGTPIVEINPKSDNSGIWLTRTGTDLSMKLFVDYTVHGSALNGTDIEVLSGVKKLRPNKQTVAVPVVPTASATSGETVKFKLTASGDYVRPVVKSAVVTLP